MPCEWTMLFFLKAIPQAVWLQTANIRMVTDPALLDLYSKLMKERAGLGAFSGDPKRDGVCFAFVKVERDSEGEALEAGLHLVGHVLDCVNIVTGESPQIAEVALLRYGNEPNARVRVYRSQAWVTWDSPGSGEWAAWRSRYQENAELTTPFLERLLDDNWASLTPLLRQMAHSARLFRKASTISEYGLEFLGKFIAVEGLVMGDTTTNKHATLAKRIPALVPRSALGWEPAALVDRMWECRCLIAHQARAQSFGKGDDLVSYESFITKLDTIARCVFVFAAANVHRARTVTDLWNYVRSYQLPSHFQGTTAHDKLKAPARCAVLSQHLEVHQVGVLFDAFLKDNPPSAAASKPATA